ncbi:XkdF-like putative serine protease domain-containing protein [Flavobacterium sp. AC]|uniref:XkdF-like putative serine protease domain-containing protein n=1 Tax=Flavobacterium azizsancarii TaxID=2961580 RepID=A0ABT4W8W1_9FLAO|nr:XkdF-like putative serine protease domain-containing protein [Flavobacterium azizsancarii]MDA6068969.1 XkdF-like putative serine protease domain-containing protein [Flavobacterium azizsancarii]
MEYNEKDGLPIRKLVFDADEMVGIYACSLVDSPAIDVQFLKFSKENNEIIECNCSKEDTETVDFSDEFVELLLSKGEDVDTDNWELLDERKVESDDDLVDFASAVQQSGSDSEQDNDIFKIRYEYAPLKTSSNSRDFCKKMVSANKSYKVEDVEYSNANPGLGPSGTEFYNIMLFKGGVNCQHYFNRKIYFNKGNKSGVSTFEALKRIGQLNKSDAKKAKLTALDPKVSQIASSENNYWRLSSQEIRFSKTDEYKRILTSPVLIPEQLIYRKLSDGECYVKADSDTIEQLQQNFFKKQYNHNSTIEHDDNQIIKGVYFFESWIVDSETNDKANSLGFSVPRGTWMMSMKVENDEIWQDVLDGKFKGFSIDSQLGIEPLKKEKNNKEQMNYSKIKEAIIAKILLEAELKEFKIDDSLTLHAEDLAKDQVVFDADKAPFANAEFVYENNKYKTDENGVIVEIKAIEPVEIEQAEAAPAEQAPNDLQEELDAANKKIEEQEIEIQSLKAEIVSLKDENINLAKQPKVEGIQLKNQEADNAPAANPLEAIRKALKK